MADGSPPLKRQRTEGDVFLLQLENQLPDELVASSGSGNLTLNNGTNVSMKQTPHHQTSQPSASQSSISSVPSQQPMVIPHPPSVQTHKKLTQLLQSGGHNSPKYVQTSSPSASNAINSPRPPRQPSQPQPSPLSTSHNSLQSPSAGSMAAVMNNMKSPPSSLPRPNSRPSSAMNATPSPRPGSIPGGPMSVGSSNMSGINTSLPSTSNSMRSPMMQNQMPLMNSANVANQNSTMHPGMQKYGMINGANRQMQLVTQQGITNPNTNRQNVQNNMNAGMHVGQMSNQQPGMQMQPSHYNSTMQQHMQSQVSPMNPVLNSVNNFGQQSTGNMSVGSMQVGLQRPMPMGNNSNSVFSNMPRPQQQNMQSVMSQAGVMAPNQMGNGISMQGNNNINLDMLQQTSSGNIIGIDKTNANMQFNSMRPGMSPLQANNNMQTLNQQQQISRLANQLDPQAQNIGMNMPPMQVTNTIPMQQHIQGMPPSLNQVNPVSQGPGGGGPGPPQTLGQVAGTNQSGASGNSSAPADPEKRRLIQQQLVLLLHAYKCAKKEHNGEAPNCTLPHCRTMKEVLRHMNVCTQGKSCQVAHCASSRQIIAHWRACNRHDCVVCLPLKSVPNNNNPTLPGSQSSMQPRWPTPGLNSSTSIAVSSASPGTSVAAPPYPGQANDAMSAGLLTSNNSNLVSGMQNIPNGLTSNQVAGMPQIMGGSQIADTGSNFFHSPRVEREWHKDVTEELRNHLVQKLVQAIFPTPQRVSLTDERMKKLVTFARKVEGDMYEQANSRSEYYHLLAEKIYKIQKELEEKRALRMRGRTGPVTGHRIAMNGTGAMGPGGDHVVSPITRPMGIDPYLQGRQGRMTTPQSNVGGLRLEPSQVASNLQENLPNNIMVGAPGQPLMGTQKQPNHDYSDTIMKFVKANDEIRLQKQTATMHSTQGMTGLQSNSMTNVMGGMNSGVMVKPEMQSGTSTFPAVQAGNKIGNNLPGGHRSQSVGHSSAQMIGVSSAHNQSMNQPKLTSSQPRLESLLRATNTSPLSSNINSSTSNSYFHNGPQQQTFENTSQVVTLSMQPQHDASPSSLQRQQPLSLQEILQGPISCSVATSTTTTTVASSMELTTSLSSSSATSTTVPSPSPFVSKPQSHLGKSSKDMNMQVMAGSSLASNGSSDNMSKPCPESSGKGMEVSTEPSIKMEENSGKGNMSISTGGKPWSPAAMDTSSMSTSTLIKSEVKMEANDGRFSSATSSVTTTTATLTPFVKQESMSTPTSSAASTASVKAKCPRKVFEPLELQIALLPVVEKLYMQDPEALPFRQPVDPDKLNIPDYFDIIKEPMDLASIRKNLEMGKYKEPWEFMADIWLMFNNAWLYNRRTTRVYKYCSKLKEIFEAEIDPVMQSLGYCCGRKMEFMPMTLCCYGKQLCTIPTGATYYEYQNRYDYCEKCFNEIPGDAISLADDSSKPESSVTTIPKTQFEKKKNDVLDPEPFETCNECGRKMHKICVLHMSPIWPEGFTCDKCHAMRGKQRKMNRYVASKLPQNKLGEHIERRVNNYIKRHDTNGEAGPVHIRVVYSGDKTVEVRSGMKTRFVDTKEMPETFPYRAKAFFAFEEIDSVDVCFFGVHVQEYGADAPKPNQRRVYLSYLDSVHFFRPRHLRTAVYHEILIGYFEYCKLLGYEFAHIWACPPCEGDDYIFHCHPPEQKIPKPKRLQDWYKKMLDKAISEQVIVDYKDIFHQAKEDRLQSARELPYFEGDFWPNVLEESIKEIEQEEEDRKQAEANEQAAAEESDPGNSCSSKNGKNKKSKKASSKKASQRTTKKKLPQITNDLSDKLYQTMEKHKEVFFVIRLNSVETISKMGPTVDPDGPMQCDLMDGRDAFLTLAREKHYEFSSLRRAKWSSMAMMVELHTQGQDRFSYMCNNCRNNVETRYQCTICHDFDLCVNCFRQIGHEHRMEKMGFGLDDGSNGSPGAGSSNAKSSHIPVERCMQSLVHACQCRNANCNMPACVKMKKVVHHAKNCKKKTNGTCPICKQLIALCCYHAKHCQEKKCPVTFCHNIKNKVKQQEIQHRVQQTYLMRRRMALMSRNITQAPSTPSAANAPGTPQQNTASPKPMSGAEHHAQIPQPSPMTGMKQENPHPQSNQNPQQRKPMDPPVGMAVTHNTTNLLQMQIGNQQPSQHMMPSPLMNNNQQQAGFGGGTAPGVGPMVGMTQPVLTQSHGIMSPSQTMQATGSFPTGKYPSPPPEAAVRAAKHAQQLADQQAKERERVPYINPSPNQNQIINRPINPGMTRPICNANPGPVGWQNPMQNRPQMRQMMPGLKQVIEHIRRGEGNQPGGSGGSRKNSEHLMNFLKTNPQLVSNIIKQRKMQQHGHLNQQKPMMTQQQGMAVSVGNVQQSNISGGMQQMIMQNSVNQPVMNMQPMQGGMGNMQQMQWQQQQQQQRRLQPQQQQGQFQTPAPPYPQAINQQRMVNMRFPQHQQPQQQQHRMQTQIRHQGMNPTVQGGMNMQQGMMGQSVSNVQNVQSPMQHHVGLMNTGQVAQVTGPIGGQPLPLSRSPSQPMPSGRVSAHLPPHPMAGRTTPIGQGVNQPSNMSHIVSTMDQSQANMMSGMYNRGMGSNMNPHGVSGMGFTAVNQEMVQVPNSIPGQDGLEHFVKGDQ